jgi:hypothetical protein
MVIGAAFVMMQDEHAKKTGGEPIPFVVDALSVLVSIPAALTFSMTPKIEAAKIKIHELVVL